MPSARGYVIPKFCLRGFVEQLRDCCVEQQRKTRRRRMLRPRGEVKIISGPFAGTFAIGERSAFDRVRLLLDLLRRRVPIEDSVADVIEVAA